MIAARRISGQCSRVESKYAWINTCRPKMTLLVTITIFQRGGP